MRAYLLIKTVLASA